MRSKATLLAAVAAGLLFMAPGIDSARADHYRVQGHGGQQAYNGKSYGYHGQQLFGDQRYGGGYAYGKRAHTYYDGGLTRKQHKKLRRIRSHFDNERAFRRYLRHNKPRLFHHYMAHVHQQQRYGYHHRHPQTGDHRCKHRQHYVWQWNQQGYGY